MKKIGKKFSKKVTYWIGSPASLVVHTIFFAGMFSLHFFGVPSSDILLVLTTIVSLEAIYLAIFIQITVNEHSESLEEVSEDIVEIQEGVEEIQEDVEGIEKDVDSIQENVEEIQENVDELQEDVEEMEKEEEEEEKLEKIKEEKEAEMMLRIEDQLGRLIEEVIELKDKKDTRKKIATKATKKK